MTSVRGLCLTAVLCWLAAATLVRGQAAPITITITAPSTAITSGCGFRISIGIKNNLAKPIQIQDLLAEPPDRPAQGPVLLRIFAKGAGGQAAPVSAYVLAMRRRIPNGSRIVATLPAGTTLRTQAIVTQLYDLSAPGKYRVWVMLKRGPYTYVKSNILTVTVAPPS